MEVLSGYICRPKNRSNECELMDFGACLYLLLPDGAGSRMISCSPACPAQPGLPGPLGLCREGPTARGIRVRSEASSCSSQAGLFATGPSEGPRRMDDQWEKQG